jgi:hypothetical protein
MLDLQDWNGGVLKRMKKIQAEHKNFEQATKDNARSVGLCIGSTSSIQLLQNRRGALKSKSEVLPASYHGRVLFLSIAFLLRCA